MKAFSRVKATKLIETMERLEQIKIIANNLKIGFTKAVKALHGWFSNGKEIALIANANLAVLHLLVDRKNTRS